MNGKNLTVKYGALLAALVVLATSVCLQPSSEGEPSESSVLIDMGNGDTYWASLDASQTDLDHVLNAAAESFGLTYSSSASEITVNGRTSSTISTVTASWRYYVWNGASWTDTAFDGASAIPTRSVAIGFYPAGTVPSETPVEMESWTQVRGNATMDKTMSADADPESEMTTVLAKSQGSNNYVTGCVLIARGNVYAFYNGGYMNSQETPSLYCFDRYTGEEKWHVNVPSGVGYETQTGCIVGDYYYLPTTYGYIYRIPLAGPGAENYYVAFTKATILDSDKNPAVTSVQYRLSGSGDAYSDAVLEDKDVDAFDVPVEIGKTYDVTISDGSVTYYGTIQVDSADALGVKLTASDSVSAALIHDSSMRVTYSYSDVTKAYFSKIKVSDIEGRTAYSTGPASLTYSDGAIFFGTSAGNVYCIDLDLNTLWTTNVKGQMYFDALTVAGGKVFAGTYAGKLNILDETDGSVEVSESVVSFHSVTYEDGGKVGTPVKLGDYLYFSVSDGLGMNSTQGGVAVYRYSEGALTKVALNTDVGTGSSFLTPVSDGSFTGVYFCTSNGLCRMDQGGTVTVVNGNLTGIRASPSLVNGEYLLMQDYQYNKRGIGGMVYKVTLGGEIVGEYQRSAEIDQWCMSPVIAVGEYIYAGTDNGFYIAQGRFVMPESSSEVLDWGLFAAAALVAASLATCFLLGRRRGLGPFRYIAVRLTELSGFHNDAMSKTKANKRRLAFVLLLGTVSAAAMFFCCLAYGPSMNISPLDAVGSMFSAIEKGGNGLNLQELVVYESRLPRAIAAMAVGMGLAVAGCLYQAVIRNPMVDPYIMGVSSGAGTFAVAAIANGFTLFGLIGSSGLMIPVLAVVGGLFAFGLTMLIAYKAGNTATSYVLAGVVIGLAFSSVQTVILTTSDSEKLHSAVSWLFGSFTGVDWGSVWLIFFPALFLSLATLLWAKELNLVLLGDDNAQQMGLDVKKFDTWMLILASVLTSVCVAFVGIIGFVGLVVPHICRMILGGDHRLVLPASIVLGAALMLLADMLARMVMMPIELPVGAITTVIGVPVFAYLLVKKGRMYNG